MSFDRSKLLASLTPPEYDGKSAQDGLAFLASAKVYHNILDPLIGADKYIVWAAILNRLKDDAAAWAGPHLVAWTSQTVPWSDWDGFETAFKAHFCAVDDEAAATAELVKLGKTVRKIGAVKEYTAEFNAVAARTRFSDPDKRERYRAGLPPRIKDQLAVTEADISDLPRMQKVVLSLDQRLQARDEERPKGFSWKQKGQKAAATGDKPRTPNKDKDCYNCGRHGHIARDCRSPKKDGARIASSSSSDPTPPTPSSSSSSTSDELAALKAQLKMVEERIAAMSLDKRQEDF